MKTHHARLDADEKEILKNIEVLFKDHPIWDYCQRVKGFSTVAVLTFLGYINPYIDDTGGKTKSYLDSYQGRCYKLESGQRLIWKQKVASG